MNKIEKHDTEAVKQGWVRPELKRLEAGAAESSDGLTPDGSGQQAS